jgi:hypothetical protein
MSGTTSPLIQDEEGEEAEEEEPIEANGTPSLPYVPFGPLSTVSEVPFEEEEATKEEEKVKEEPTEKDVPAELMQEYAFMAPLWTPSSVLNSPTRFSLLIGNYLKTGSPRKQEV